MVREEDRRSAKSSLVMQPARLEELPRKDDRAPLSLFRSSDYIFALLFRPLPGMVEPPSVVHSAPSFTAFHSPRS